MVGVSFSIPETLPCDSSPCENGGTCLNTNSDTSYVCECDPVYCGTNCEMRKLPYIWHMALVLMLMLIFPLPTFQSNLLRFLYLSTCLDTLIAQSDLLHCTPCRTCSIKHHFMGRIQPRCIYCEKITLTPMSTYRS